MIRSKTSVLRLFGLDWVALTRVVAIPVAGTVATLRRSGETCRSKPGHGATTGPMAAIPTRRSGSQSAATSVASAAIRPTASVKQCDFSYTPTDGDTRGPDTSAAGPIAPARTRPVASPTRAPALRSRRRYVYRNVQGPILCSARTSAIRPTASRRPASTRVQAGTSTTSVGAAAGTGTGTTTAAGNSAAAKGDRCSFAAKPRFRYGTDGKYIVRRAVNGIRCSVDTFGRDPPPISRTSSAP